MSNLPAQAIGRRLEPEGLGGSGVGASAGYAVTTHARTCSSVAPASKRRCRWPPCGHCTRMGIRALWRAPELSGVIGAPREGSGLAPRRLGRRLHLERLLGELSGLGLCLCLACQPFQLVRWSRFVRFRANRSKSTSCRSCEIERDRAFPAAAAARRKRDTGGGDDVVPGAAAAEASAAAADGAVNDSCRPCRLKYSAAGAPHRADVSSRKRQRLLELNLERLHVGSAHRARS